MLECEQVVDPPLLQLDPDTIVDGPAQAELTAALEWLKREGFMSRDGDRTIENEPVTHETADWR